ncbi:hypothetical protein M2459_002823 [Parabacteroides sp. PF5-5]|nr:MULTISPECIES: hypothetical protein [unclassified Parabacteroides]MEA4904069.1 hypothetical protein [Petrimonas sp.]MDH6306033.1 hypothetical protein [Parabacteroides sp. PH5-39]MDH6317069.1 hypothetical protein [Parabacteroides sp. PF5-13]MDH6320822.1 hypothetical protein [Parabacteroides sp. PH5-13]MDH6324476.1 hypothetical protein [Parabacteroides sp. PH5-8]
MTSIVTLRQSFYRNRLDYHSINSDFILISAISSTIQSQFGN